MEYRYLLLSLAAALAYLMVVDADLHCHCNAPSCVSTGYMCRSTTNQCYSFYSTNGAITISSYGCAEDLPSEPKSLKCVQNNLENDAKIYEGPDSLADVKLESETETETNKQKSVIVCCNEDMCNHALEHSDVAILRTIDGARKDLTQDRALLPPYDMPENYTYGSEQELWFKAAVIAVPIAGGFILLLLVLLAVRMLRNDKKRQSRILQMRTHRSLAKAHIYVSDHFQKKGKTKKAESLYAHNLNAYTDSVQVHGGSNFTQLPQETSSSPRKVKIEDHSWTPSICPDASAV